VVRDGPVAPSITLDVLLEMLRGSAADDREWAATELAILPARNNPRVVQALVQSARDPVPSVRVAALRSLVRMRAGQAEVYTAAAPLLQDPDNQVRLEAYQTLRNISAVR
jgi:hypothetical protein